MSADAARHPADLRGSVLAVGTETGGPLRGPELVQVSEDYYGGVFLGAIVFVSLASIFALALMPTRNSAPSSLPPVTVALAALIVVAAPFALRYAAPLYRLLRRRPRLELVIVAAAAALVAYPLRSELWWPSCGLLMLLAMLAPLPRALAYCFAVLLANLVAHVVAGDLDETPAVAIIGLWIGLVFWTTMFGVITDRLASEALRSNMPDDEDAPAGPVRVQATVEVQQPAADVGGTSRPVPVVDPARIANRLTARQLQVAVLIASGVRYRDIAACLSISERQVQRHVGDATRRLRVKTTEELAAAIVALGIVPAPDAENNG